jgi:DNA repair exonuclease SbcCD ATPase subunit
MAKKKINTENKIKAVYPSSLIAQNFSEGDDNFHGYILWDLTEKDNITYEKINIESDYTFKTLKVNRFTDFNDLDLIIENPSKYMNIRVIWTTFPSDYNTENISKVNSYIKSKYGDTHKIVHPKDFIVGDEIEIEDKDDLRIENITSKDVQHKIFKSFLEEQGYDESYINEIIDIDNEISKRVEYAEVDNIIWKPIKMNGTNFRSYDEIDFDFRNYQGITQIGGKNRGGKSSIIQLLMYVLYGKTIETEKIQKNGDNRFINNKSNVDYCNGHCVIEANGEYYGVFRQTNRKWNRTKTEISATPTIVKYYKLSSPDEEFTVNNEISEENVNLSEEDRTKTQKVINKIIGDYDNFNRLVLTTADTLNKILSVNKADFIDNLLYDLGLDIFDKKLEEFKSYKSEFQKNTERVVINIESSEERIKNYKEDIKQIEIEINNIKNNEILDIDGKLKVGEGFKDDLIKKLHTINPDIESLNPNDINNKILKYTQEGVTKRDQYRANQQKIKELKVNYDSFLLEKCINEKDLFKQRVYEQKDIINTKKDEIREVQNAKSKLQTDIFLLEKEIKSISDENEKLEHSKTCPTCKQVLREEDVAVIKTKILSNSDIINDKKSRIEKFNNKLPDADKKVNSISEEINQINLKIDNINTEMESVLQKIGELTNDKNEVEERERLIQRNEVLKSEMEIIKLKIEKEEKLLEEYNKSLEQIEDNKKINDKILQAQQRLNELKEEKENLFTKITNKTTDIKQREYQINEINENILKFKKQEKTDSLHKIYQSLIHRDGIPTKLLKQHSIPIINKTLSRLLENVSFNVWLDPEEITLKMSDISKTDAVIDTISGSGMERTFSAIAFKFCLNELNIKSRPSLIILDEVTGKLVDESVEHFIEFLSIVKKKIDNILIIEHTHDVNPDHYIQVIKNEKGISELFIENN